MKDFNEIIAMAKKVLALQKAHDASSGKAKHKMKSIYIDIKAHDQIPEYSLMITLHRERPLKDDVVFYAVISEALSTCHVFRQGQWINELKEGIRVYEEIYMSDIEDSDYFTPDSD